MKKLCLTFFAILFLVFSACSNQVYFLQSTFTFNVIEGNKSKTENLQKDLVAFEKLTSTTLPTSDVYKINNAVANQKVQVSQTTIDLLNISKQLYSQTDGLFNVALYPAICLWGFNTDGTMKKPSQQEIEQVMHFCDLNDFVVEGNTIAKKYSESKLDFGGIAKGYIVGKITQKASVFNKSAILNVGGNLAVIGDKKGQGFVIGLTHPRSVDLSQKYILQINLKNCFASTSGDYERYFEQDGIRYTHILDGKSGLQSSTDLVSATAISQDLSQESGTLCDAFSTIMFLLGKDKAIEFAEQNNIKYILVDKNMNIVENLEE